MYLYWVFLHIIGVAAFLAVHGVSMFVLFRIRSVGADRAKVLELIETSHRTITPTYISIGILLVGGFGAAITAGFWTQLWIVGSVFILVLSIALMATMAKDYFQKVSAACELRPSGVPRKSDEELEELMRAPVSAWIAVIGGVGLLVILYLMVFKPAW
jgi:hypothetical protein